MKLKKYCGGRFMVARVFCAIADAFTSGSDGGSQYSAHKHVILAVNAMAIRVAFIINANVKMSCGPLWAACGSGMFVI